jgi:hypothetical protein
MKPRQCAVQTLVYNRIARHDICIWLMLQKLNEALLLNDVWWVQALDNESKASLNESPTAWFVWRVVSKNLQWMASF